VIEIKEEQKIDGRRWRLDFEREGEPCRGGSCARPKDSGQPPKTNPEKPPNLLSGQPRGFAPTVPLITNHYPLTTFSQPTYWLAIGDVSGHGVPAGLVMMMVQSTIRLALQILPNGSPKEILHYVNQVIHENIQKLGEDKYMTITLFSIQPNGKIYYSGLHQDIVIFRAEKEEVEIIETKGMWIGMTENIEGMVQVDHLELAANDVMLLYTDGITEAVDKHGNMFSEEKLQQLFKKSGRQNPAEIKNEILQALNGYSCHDDITLMVIRKI
jgi:serine phosphatase RsbU (regulator of sigma subunit)